MSSVNAVVEQLGRHRLDGQPLIDANRLLKDADSEAGYDIQDGLAAWLTAHGQGALAGYKIGATAKGMQEALGVPGPVYGHILSGNVYRSSATFKCNPDCKPGVECEIAFRLGEDLPTGRSTYSRGDVADRIAAVMPAIEIVENRYGEFHDCSLALLTADDFFHKACVVGEPVNAWRGLALAASTGRLAVNGEQAATGLGSDVLDDPLKAVVWLANKLAARNIGLTAGQIILTGSMTPVQWITALPARIEIHIEGLETSAVGLTGS